MADEERLPGRHVTQKVNDSLTTQHIKPGEMLKTLTTGHLQQKLGNIKQQSPGVENSTSSSGAGSQEATSGNKK